MKDIDEDYAFVRDGGCIMLRSSGIHVERLTSVDKELLITSILHWH